MIFISQDFLTAESTGCRRNRCIYFHKQAPLDHKKPIICPKWPKDSYLLEKSRQLVYNNILRKQKPSINMNYCIDIQQNDQNNKNTSDSEHSEQYPQQKCVEQITKPPKKSKVKMSSFSWSRTEERKYINFLKANSKLFSLSPKERKEIKINVMMSYAIKTRTSAQCHSHHQKMIIKFENIQNIIEKHLYLFEKDKEPKVQKKREAVPAAEPEEAQVENQEESIIGQEIRAEPLWWRYLDLMDDQEEVPWHNSYFFSQ